jgi:alpha-glucosidase
VAPVESNRHLEKVYLPEGNWYDLYTGQVYSGNQIVIVETPIEKIPLFVRAGAIIPIQSQVFSMNEQPEETLKLHLFAGAESAFSLCPR